MIDDNNSSPSTSYHRDCECRLCQNASNELPDVLQRLKREYKSNSFLGANDLEINQVEEEEEEERLLLDHLAEASESFLNKTYFANVCVLESNAGCDQLEKLLDANAALFRRCRPVCERILLQLCAVVNRPGLCPVRQDKFCLRMLSLGIHSYNNTRSWNWAIVSEILMTCVNILLRDFKSSKLLRLGTNLLDAGLLFRFIRQNVTQHGQLEQQEAQYRTSFILHVAWIVLGISHSIRDTLTLMWKRTIHKTSTQKQWTRIQIEWSSMMGWMCRWTYAELVDPMLDMSTPRMTQDKSLRILAHECPPDKKESLLSFVAGTLLVIALNTRQCAETAYLLVQHSREFQCAHILQQMLYDRLCSQSDFCEQDSIVFRACLYLSQVDIERLWHKLNRQWLFGWPFSTTTSLKLDMRATYEPSLCGGRFPVSSFTCPGDELLFRGTTALSDELTQWHLNEIQRTALVWTTCKIKNTRRYASARLAETPAEEVGVIVFRTKSPIPMLLPIHEMDYSKYHFECLELVDILHSRDSEEEENTTEIRARLAELQDHVFWNRGDLFSDYDDDDEERTVTPCTLDFFPSTFGLSQKHSVDTVMRYRHREADEAARLVDSPFNGWVYLENHDQIMLWNASRWLVPEALIVQAEVLFHDKCHVPNKQIIWPAAFGSVVFDLSDRKQHPSWLPIVSGKTCFEWRQTNSFCLLDDYDGFEAFAMLLKFPNVVLLTDTFLEDCHLPRFVRQHLWPFAFDTTPATQIICHTRRKYERLANNNTVVETTDSIQQVARWLDIPHERVASFYVETVFSSSNK